MPARSKSRSDRPSLRSKGAPARRTGGFDAHLHLSRYWPDLARNSYGRSVDYTVDGLLHELARSGIDGGLLLPPIETPGVAAARSELAELSKRSGGRLRYAASIDPTVEPAEFAGELERLRAWPGYAAIKLYPGYRPFYPHDPRLDPVYELAHQRSIPVLFHQGDTLHATGRLRYARPLEVDEVAVRFPELDLVICHFGNPWVTEAAEVVYKNRRVYADTSGLLAPPTAPYFAPMRKMASRLLQDAVWAIGSTDRILYGSDWPLQSIEDSVGLVGALELRPGDRGGILGGNARRLFRAPPPPGAIPPPPQP